MCVLPDRVHVSLQYWADLEVQDASAGFHSALPRTQDSPVDHSPPAAAKSSGSTFPAHHGGGGLPQMDSQILSGQPSGQQHPQPQQAHLSQQARDFPVLVTTGAEHQQAPSCYTLATFDILEAEQPSSQAHKVPALEAGHLPTHQPHSDQHFCEWFAQRHRERLQRREPVHEINQLARLQNLFSVEADE
ncbi:uncharacterized protein B0I36DRAFT_356196 [Microdochium trichocladiopsis]|uniref:Uncharacterized protein n=1 Tax=Microdochium trichocladiopsis TaxID=1682393 RepID=A0A9P8XQI2_9PEZI|nr:uncharacterized protein B0I36DRAFT_356196 [Microdochium trichocladiopsis]KAH7012098.1 hypothetical protein B0I36DRAFT_356196 [Microdochium trichocladiopsis]